MTKIFLATLLAFTATPALAEPPVYVSSTVQVADLDLSTEVGQRKLDRRLTLAAKEVCGTASNVDPEGHNQVRQCRKDALARVADQRDQRIAAVTDKPIEVAAR